MATGQNFTRIQGQTGGQLGRLKKQLEELKDENERIIQQYKKLASGEIEEGNLSEKLHKNIEKIKHVEWLIYCEEYDDNLRRNWK